MRRVLLLVVALVLGPLQFMPKVRAHRPIHRTIGRVYLLAGVLPSAVAAIPVAMMSGRLVTQFGLTTAAVLWLVTGVLAYLAARRRDFESHRAWMMRNYALTFLAVTSRVLVPLIPIGQTLGWVVNLIVAEALIRRGRRRTRTAPSPDSSC